jgi:hypothetical protein
LDWGWGAAIHPDDPPRILETFREALNSVKPFEVEGRFRRFDGEFRWFLSRGSPRHVCGETPDQKGPPMNLPSVRQPKISKSRIMHPKITRLSMAAACLALLGIFAVSLHGQAALLQQRVAELKESTAKNKQALAQYTWVEKLTVYLKGEEKKTESFQVRMGPDGKQQKTPLGPAPAAQNDSGARGGGRVRQRIVAKKKEEYEDYAEQMKTLAQQYLPPDKDAIQAAYAKGNVSVTPSDAVPGEIKIVIVNYAKTGDSMTLLFDKEQKQIRSIKIASYMDNPSDAMNLSVQFDRLPDGTSHASTAKIEGVSKQLTINTQNSDYRKL